jgi:hypothetical protein
MYHIFLGIFHRFAFFFLLILQHFPFHYILAFNFKHKKATHENEKSVDDPMNEPEELAKSETAEIIY